MIFSYSTITLWVFPDQYIFPLFAHACKSLLNNQYHDTYSSILLSSSNFWRSSMHFLSELECWNIGYSGQNEILWGMAQAKYTVTVCKFLLRNCVQAHDNTLEVLQHIILYLSTRRPQIIGSPGHVRTCLLKISYFQELWRPSIFFQKSTKIIKFVFAVLCASRGGAPPTHQGRF